MELLAGILSAMLWCAVLPAQEQPHPRLLLTADEECRVTEAVQSSEWLGSMETEVYRMADEAVRTAPTEYRKDGRRLLSQSRRSLGRLFSLSYAYRFSDKDEYLTAAIAELSSVCSFPDWNPSHYLDVAEMCMGVAIAYDWLYAYLPEEVRTDAATAIERFALDTALDPHSNGFYDGVSNWLQVCNAGLVFGALAIAEKVPEKAKTILENYRRSIIGTVDSYDPDGAYPEGPGYWAYGTEFNALLNCQLEKSGIEPYVGHGGFARTGFYHLHSVGPSGRYFNYADSDSRVWISIADFCFAAANEDSSLLWNAAHRPVIMKHRLLPAALVFASRMKTTDVHSPSELSWCGHGETPVYFARSSWDDPDALFFGVKGGKANNSHAHQDQGSFVFEALGERWIIDLGNEDYTRVEAAGVGLWNTAQCSHRWSLMAYDNMHHSTLTFDGQHQNVDGKAEIIGEISSRHRKGAVIDLSPCYDNVGAVIRNICLVNDSFLEITDAVRTDGKSVTLEWNLMTAEDTECSVTPGGDIILRRNGKALRVRFHGPKGMKLHGRTENCTPKTSYERLRAKRVGFTAELPADSENEFKVTLKPITK